MSPIGVSSYTEPNHTSSWRNQLKLHQTHLSIAALTEQNRGHSTDTPTSTTRIADKALSRSDHSHTLQSPLRVYWVDDSFTPLKLSIQDVFKAIKGQPWVKCPEAKPHDFARPRAKVYCSIHDNKGHRTSQCCSLRKYLEDLVQQDYL